MIKMVKKKMKKLEILKENIKKMDCLKNGKGITLIALVITIVVLLILAGVTINLLFGDDGIFHIANQSKIEYEIGALKDRINNVIADWSIERLTKTEITVNDLWDKMVEADIITDSETDVEGPEKEGENDVYQVTTNEGYVVEIIVMPDGSVVIGDVVKGDKLPPKIVNVETTSGTNNIQITVTMNRWENGTISYYYKKDGEEDTSYKTFKENTTELTANIEGLEQNVVYNIKIVAENENGRTEKVVNETTGELKEGTISQKGETIWSNGTASIELETTETGVTIQYQIDTMDEEWLNYEGAITGLNHGQTVYAVITDGSNQSGYTSIDILDEENPQEATINLSGTSSNTTGNITATVTHIDNESGVAIEDCRWVYTTNPSLIGTEISNYPSENTFSSNGQQIILKATTSGTYYLHVLTVDKAGNKTETISQGITVTQLVTEITLNETNVTIEQGQTLQLMATITPNNANNKNITWNSNSDVIASVSSTGLVTAKTIGITTITATAKDGSGVTATCNVTVEKIPTDGSYSSSKGVNTPDLADGALTPVKWVNNTLQTTTADDPEWYSYTTTDKKWANAQTKDGSLWVWIPRYAYQISSNYHTNSTSGGTINIKFMKGTTNEAADGTKTWNNSSGQGNWNIHPGFNYSSTASGIWVAKFEASRNNATASSEGSGNTIKIQPGVQSWRGISVNDIYTTCLNYAGTTLGNANLNSHMMKNTEWGAVAYLAQSSYGKNAEVWINPNSNFLTGQAGTEASAMATTSTSPYNSGNGPQASTTGNVYGVYDMSGGAYEYTAAYVNNGNKELSSNGANLVNGAAYTKDVYTKGSEDDGETNYNANSSKYGDAVYETSNHYSNSRGAWDGNYALYPETVRPFFLRGCTFDLRGWAGLYAFNNDYGIARSSYSFRPVLVQL